MMRILTAIHNWFTQVYPFPQLVVFGLIAFAAFVMASGKPGKPVPGCSCDILS
jgi:hypothetical protein